MHSKFINSSEMTSRGHKASMRRSYRNLAKSNIYSECQPNHTQASQLLLLLLLLLWIILDTN
jgi:hypothetical protein